MYMGGFCFFLIFGIVDSHRWKRAFAPFCAVVGWNATYFQPTEAAPHFPIKIRVVQVHTVFDIAEAKIVPLGSV